MDKLRIVGGKRLCGTVEIHGAKNAVLPILAACVLPQGPCVVSRCPDILDLQAAADILRCLGCECEKTGSAFAVDASMAKTTEIPPKLMRKMRASVNFLGALLAKHGECTLSLPGGCSLGGRPIDYHISALGGLGVQLEEKGQELHFFWPRPKEGEITLPFPSVGATENVVLAALAVPGTVVLHNAAKEPEVCDLCGFLRAMGAKISGDGTDSIHIEGGKTLFGAAYAVMPDRMEAATYLAMAAACGGKITLQNAKKEHLLPVLQVLETCGCRIGAAYNTVTLEAPQRLRGNVSVETAAYPGFPTDAQAPVMAALLQNCGTAEIRDTVFPARFRHVQQLRKFGADIRLENDRAIVRGVESLRPAHASATDLRGGAGVVIAALQAEGESTVDNMHFVGRGYAGLKENLRLLGAEVSDHF